MTRFLNRSLSINDVDAAIKVRNLDRWIDKLQRKRQSKSKNSNMDEIEEEDEDEDSYGSDSPLESCEESDGPIKINIV